MRITLRRRRRRCVFEHFGNRGGVRNTSLPWSVATSSVTLELPPLSSRTTRAPLYPSCLLIQGASSG